MKTNENSFLTVAILLAVMVFAAFGAEFIAPAAGPVAFRRDRITLDVEDIADLSRKLATLAAALPGETATDQRAAAQLLALAIALDPSNARARHQIATYRSGRHKPDDDAGLIKNCHASIWQAINWLETPDAGRDGQALAACLKDVAMISDPDHPRSAALREAGEIGAWAGWIPERQSDEPRTIVDFSEKAEDAPSEAKTTAEKSVLLAQAEVQSVLWQRTGQGESTRWELATAPLQMTATRASGENETPSFPLVIGPDEGQYGGLSESARMIGKLLENHQMALPRGAWIRITSLEFERSLGSGRPQVISAAAAVLASAAVTGREPSAIIVGQINESGAFLIPAGFWNQLQSLGPGNGQRLVLPAAAAAWLPSFLAMEKPGFYMDYEVLLADDFTHLLDLTAKTPAEPVAAAAGKFREIRERLGTQDLRSYLANRFVRQRLGELAQEAPYHASAGMLFIQSSGNRPTVLPRMVLVAELRKAIAPMAWIANLGESDFNAVNIKKIGGTYDLCRSSFDQLEKYADKTDNDLLERSRAVIFAIRTLNRVANSRSEQHIVMGATRSARIDVSRLYNELIAELAENSDKSQ